MAVTEVKAKCSITRLSLRSKPSATLKGKGESQPAQQQCWGRGLGAGSHPQAKHDLKGVWYHKDGSRVYDAVYNRCHLPPGTVQTTDGERHLEEGAGKVGGIQRNSKVGR